jgi:Flp pilus assembly protein TadG
VSTELVLLTPLFIVLLLFVALAGRIVTARSDVVGASRDAARAASIARSAPAAERDARAAAEATLAERSLSCSPLQVDVDTSGFEPGGTVAVEISCGIPLRDLALLRIPGSRTVESRSVEVVDRYRGVDDAR